MLSAKGKTENRLFKKMITSQSDVFVSVNPTVDANMNRTGNHNPG